MPLIVMERRPRRCGQLRVRHGQGHNHHHRERNHTHGCDEAGTATAPQPPPKKLTALDRLREEYETFLCQQRGLAESTIDNCTHYMERFLAFRFGNKLRDLNAITPDDIVAFLGKLKAGSRPYRYKALPSHLRNLFKFLFWSGKTRSNLASSLPGVAQTNPDKLPRAISVPKRSDG